MLPQNPFVELIQRRGRLVPMPGFGLGGDNSGTVGLGEDHPQTPYFDQFRGKAVPDYVKRAYFAALIKKQTADAQAAGPQQSAMPGMPLLGGKPQHGISPGGLELAQAIEAGRADPQTGNPIQRGQAGVPGVGLFPPPRQAMPQGGETDWGAKAGQELAPILDAISRMDMMRSQPAVERPVDPAALFNQPGGRREFGMLPGDMKAKLEADIANADPNRPATVGGDGMRDAIDPTIRDFIGGHGGNKTQDIENLRQVFARNDGTVPVNGEFIRKGHVPSGGNSDGGSPEDIARANEIMIAMQEAGRMRGVPLGGTPARQFTQEPEVLPTPPVASAGQPAMPRLVPGEPVPDVPGGFHGGAFGGGSTPQPRGVFDIPARVEQDVAQNAANINQAMQGQNIDLQTNGQRLREAAGQKSRSLGNQLLIDRAEAARSGDWGQEFSDSYNRHTAKGKMDSLLGARAAQQDRSLTPGQRLQRAIDSGGDPAFNAMISQLSPAQQVQAMIERDKAAGDKDARRIQEKGVDAEITTSERRERQEVYSTTLNGLLANGTPITDARQLAQEQVDLQFGAGVGTQPVGGVAQGMEFENDLTSAWDVPGISGWESFMAKYNENPEVAKTIMLKKFGGKAAARRHLEGLRRGKWDKFWSGSNKAVRDKDAMNSYIDELEQSLGL